MSSEIWKLKLKTMDTVFTISFILPPKKKYSKWIWCVQLLLKKLKQN